MMTACIIELNDIGVLASSPFGSTVCSPGFALLNKQELIIGEPARQQARLHPQQVNNRFWQRLGLEPVSRATDKVRHHADLAYSHLLHLYELAGKPAQVIFSIPGNFSRDQLAVLLGIARQCPFRATGLVDAAVCAAASAELSAGSVHVDLQLHQSVLTRLSADTDIRREAVQTVEGAGLLSLYERWAHIIADAFIRQCRFDPLHNAATEQYLYDHLPHYLAGDDSLLALEIPHHSRVHHARVERQLLVAAGQNLWQQLQQHAAAMLAPGGTLLFGQQWSQVPGVEHFAAHGLLLPAGAAARACRNNVALICSGGEALSFVTRLPAQRSAGTAVEVVATATAPDATQVTDVAKVPAAINTANPASHVLLNTTAYPLDTPGYLQTRNGEISWQRQQQADSVCKLYRRNQNVHLEIVGAGQVWLNGVALFATSALPALACGDRLSLARNGPEVSLIEVATDGRR